MSVLATVARKSFNCHDKFTAKLDFFWGGEGSEVQAVIADADMESLKSLDTSFLTKIGQQSVDAILEDALRLKQMFESIINRYIIIFQRFNKKATFIRVTKLTCIKYGRLNES